MYPEVAGSSPVGAPGSMDKSKNREWHVSTLTYCRGGHYDNSGNMVVDYDSRKVLSPFEEFFEMYRTVAYLHGLEATRRFKDVYFCKLRQEDDGDTKDE